MASTQQLSRISGDLKSLSIITPKLEVVWTPGRSDVIPSLPSLIGLDVLLFLGREGHLFKSNLIPDCGPHPCFTKMLSQGINVVI